jgi:hypothetical protein
MDCWFISFVPPPIFGEIIEFDTVLVVNGMRGLGVRVNFSLATLPEALLLVFRKVFPKVMNSQVRFNDQSIAAIQANCLLPESRNVLGRDLGRRLVIVRELGYTPRLFPCVRILISIIHGHPTFHGSLVSDQSYFLGKALRADVISKALAEVFPCLVTFMVIDDEAAVVIDESSDIPSPIAIVIGTKGKYRRERFNKLIVKGMRLFFLKRTFVRRILFAAV